MSVVDIKTRQPIAEAPVTIDHGEHHSRQQRVLKNLLIDSEALGIGWNDVRSWLVNALAYVDAKIELQRYGGK